MRTSAALVLALVLCSGCTGNSGPAGPQPGDECKPTEEGSFVFGLVSDTEQNTLPGAMVNAKALTHDHEISDETDGRGCYAIDIGVSQPHDLEASKDGYASQQEKSVILGSDEKRKINFELERQA